MKRLDAIKLTLYEIGVGGAFIASHRGDYDFQFWSSLIGTLAMVASAKLSKGIDADVAAAADSDAAAFIGFRNRSDKPDE